MMSKQSEGHLYDRINDVSKLSGCNVRNRPYRWSIYVDHLRTVPKGSDVLDFGAGSLRESFDLASRGFRVTSVDMNEAGLAKYYLAYDWSSNPFKPELRGNLPSERGKFSLVTAFDIIEHLPDPAAIMAEIRGIMTEDAKMFVTVPNKLTLREYMTKRRGGVGLAPGEPHLQFKTPQEWRRFFIQNGFDILEHDMVIGPCNNTAHFVAVGFRKEAWHRPFAGILDTIDRLIRPFTRSLFGWNLFVLQNSRRENFDDKC